MHSGCEKDSGQLPPINPPKEPLLTIREIVAVDRVVLQAQIDTLPALEKFYVDLFGFKITARIQDVGVLLRWELQEVLLATQPAQGPHIIMMRIRYFGRMLQIFDEQRIAYDVITQAVGHSRVAMIYDPAGNLIELFEHRPL